MNLGLKFVQIDERYCILCVYPGPDIVKSTVLVSENCSFHEGEEDG